MLISAEFPLGFGGPGKACWPHAMEEWSAAIKSLRNYPVRPSASYYCSDKFLMQLPNIGH